MADYGVYNNISIIAKVGYTARKKMFARFKEFSHPGEGDLVLDVGVTPINAPPANNFFEKQYPWTDHITMCSVEDASNLEIEFPGSKFARNESGKPLPFQENEFDIVFCSAVLEHVGDRNAQEFFLNELIRIGKKVFLTTPNQWFPIEVHTVLPFIHWLPQPIHQKLLRLLGKDFFATTENLNLLSRGTLKQMLFSTNTSVRWTFSSYRLLGWTSNILLYYRKDIESRELL